MTSQSAKLHPTEIAATLREVTVTYDGYQTRALSRVAVEIRRGEVTGVLGAKGAGISTLLKVLAGRLRVTEGSVRIFGRSPQGRVKARVGFLPGKPDANRAPGFVDRLLGRKKESPSGARGVARLAQAILGNRDLLVLDDPFADLNPGEVVEAKELIRDQVARGKTVVLGSDVLMDITDVCDRFVILHEGKVQAVGTLSELLAGTGAIRFLPAVLPKAMVERTLAVLRSEILSSSNSATAMRTTPIAEKASLSKQEKPGAASSSVAAQSTDLIDHEKLEGLMKPPDGSAKK
jgi:ABC-type multidrug transport system ATPase subunit